VKPFERTRLEKAAADCGFDLSPELVDGELVFRSAQFPETITVAPVSDDSFVLQASTSILLPVRQESEGRVAVHGWNALYQALDKAAAIARTMPNRVAQKFFQATATMPKTTEVERSVVRRVGQDLFRIALLDYWQGRCCVTGLAVPQLLRASHIQPWALCDTDEQRLDVYNGLLLSPNLDALFDGGWITFGPTGMIAVANALPPTALDLLGLGENSKIHGLNPSHSAYMEFHRVKVFRDAARIG
jgi:putative restriction endonuclease